MAAHALGFGPLVAYDLVVLARFASTLLLALAYPTLWFIGRRSFYHRWSTDRDPAGGSLRRQVLFAQATTTVLLGVLWGGLGDLGRPLAAVAIYLLASAWRAWRAATAPTAGSRMPACPPPEP